MILALKTVFRRTFSDEGTFAAKNAAEAWCAENGISVGSSQGPAPRGLLVGDFDIAKWRNLSRDERSALHGVMTGDGRNGPVHVELFANCPSISSIKVAPRTIGVV